MWTRRSFARMSPLTQQICGRIGQSKSAEWHPSPSALGVAQRRDPATALPTLSSDYLNSIISHVCLGPISDHNCYRYTPAANALAKLVLRPNPRLHAL